MNCTVESRNLNTETGPLHCIAVIVVCCSYAASAWRAWHLDPPRVICRTSFKNHGFSVGTTRKHPTPHTHSHVGNPIRHLDTHLKRDLISAVLETHTSSNKTSQRDRPADSWSSFRTKLASHSHSHSKRCSKSQGPVNDEEKAVRSHSLCFLSVPLSSLCLVLIM